MKDKWRETILPCLRGCPKRIDGRRIVNRYQWLRQQSPFPCDVMKNKNYLNEYRKWEMKKIHLIKTSSTRASSGNGTGCNSWANPGRQSSNSQLQMTSNEKQKIYSIARLTSVSNKKFPNWRSFDDGQVTLHVPDVVVVVFMVFVAIVGRCRRLLLLLLLLRHFIFIVIDGMIGLDIDPIGWMTLTSASIFVNAENGGQTNGHQIGKDTRMRTSASFAVGAVQITREFSLVY